MVGVYIYICIPVPWILGSYGFELFVSEKIPGLATAGRRKTTGTRSWSFGTTAAGESFGRDARPFNYHGPQNLHFYKVFMVNNLVSRWPKPFGFWGLMVGSIILYLQSVPRVMVSPTLAGNFWGWFHIFFTTLRIIRAPQNEGFDSGLSQDFFFWSPVSTSFQIPWLLGSCQKCRSGGFYTPFAPNVWNIYLHLP